MPYIVGWEGEDAVDRLQRTAELIDALARRIEQTLPTREEHAGQAVELSASGQLSGGELC